VSQVPRHKNHSSCDHSPSTSQTSSRLPSSPNAHFTCPSSALTPSPPAPSGVPKLSPSVKDLLTRMLEPDPRRRITLEQALQHPWFRSLPARPPAAPTPTDVSTPQPTTSLPCPMPADHAKVGRAELGAVGA
jgi:serine/threonine protein kinase